jgi:chromosome segregation ATPase
MEQTAAFVLGVLSVLAIVGVYRMFKVAFRVKDLQEDIDDLRNVINEIEMDLGQTSDLLDRRIDGEIDRVDNSVEELYKYIDSRTDKMESRCDSKFKEVETKIKKNNINLWAREFMLGEVAEWSNALVLKTSVLQGTGGSNPSFSAKN